MRERLADQIFRPHYTPNPVIARTKVAEQLSIMAAAGAADDGFRKEHGGNGNVGAAVTMIEMLAMSDLSLMVKAGVQWGLFGGAVENLGTERPQGLHRRRRRNRHHRSGIRATHHHRERRTGQPRGALRTGADPRRRGQ